MAGNIRDHALTILRTLDEHGEGDSSELGCRDILLLTGLSETLFNKADSYLIQHGLVEGTQSGLDGSRWMTAAGTDYLHTALAAQLPLTPDAERLLRYMADHSETTNWGYQTLMTALNFDEERYRAACRRLHSFDLLRIFVNQGGWEIIGISKDGHRAVYDDFKRPDAPSTKVTFDQRGQQVTYQYNAAGNINFGAVQNRQDLIVELEKLQADLSKAVDDPSIDAEVVLDAENAVRKAIAQAKKPEPDKKTIVDRLNEAKALLAGVGAAAGAIEALLKAVDFVQKHF